MNEPAEAGIAQLLKEARTKFLALPDVQDDGKFTGAVQDCLEVLGARILDRSGEKETRSVMEVGNPVS